MHLLVSKFRFLEYRLLLSQVAPYYSSLPRTVLQWAKFITCTPSPEGIKSSSKT